MQRLNCIFLSVFEMYKSFAVHDHRYILHILYQTDAIFN